MKKLNNWDHNTWLSSRKYILSFHKFLKKDINHLGQLFKERTKIPIKYSSDRRTASLGAIWKKHASKR